MTAKGIPIPDHIVEFLHGPVKMGLVTRDARLRPTSAWVYGATADGPAGIITLFVPEVTAAPTLANLADNGAVAFVFGEPISHETYQVKGRYLGHGTPNGTEAVIHDLYMDKLVAHLCVNHKFYPEALFRQQVLHPSLAIRIAVEAVYVQTPGPDAGKRIVGSDAAP